MNIALTGQNEFKGAVEGAYNKYLENGASFVDAGVIANTKDVTNDKGLVVGKVVGKVSFQGGSPTTKHVIAAPNVSQSKVGGLLKEVVCNFSNDKPITKDAPITQDAPKIDERIVARVQNQCDNTMLEMTIKKNESARQSSDTQFNDGIVSQRASNANLPTKDDEAGETAGKVFKVLGAVVGVVNTLFGTIATGGGGIPALAAAIMGLASAIADVSGGYKKMEEGVSDLIQKNHPNMTKEECDRDAAIITTCFQVAVEIAETVVSCKSPTPQQQLAGTIKEIKESGEAPEIIEQKIKEAATAVAEKVFGKKPTDEQVQAMIEQAEAIGKFSEALETAESVNEFIGTVVDFAFQIIAMLDADKSKDIQSDLELTEADHEQILSILADCGQEITSIIKRLAANQGKRETILSSSVNETSTTNDILSTIEG